LLIDQPEDDLDSRSISTQLVNYLIERKSERQIIMVSHDANLVIGADAEQVIVANRHGAKTENADGRTFDYFSGSLEHTRPRREVELALECGGIREHACDILDGGKEAFQKRKLKYRI
jgi:ABC-type Mn2+/Zn2+ transport system ATPase subunit